MSKASVGIIGGAGFIGSYCTRLFLQKGHRVKVGVTNRTKESKYAHLLALPQGHHLDIAQVEVRHREELAAFVAGCHYVVHTGTPFQLEVSDPQEELFNPTIQGTKNLLDVLGQVDTLEKVILISSVSSYNTNFPFPPEGKGPKDPIRELDKPYYSEASSPYAQAKFKANQVVEQFIREHRNSNFTILTLSPTSVMGKQLSARDDSTTAGFQYLVKNRIAPNAFFQMLYQANPYIAMIGAEDVAISIYAATQLKGHHGANLLLSSESYTLADIHRLLNGQDAIDQPLQVYANQLAQTLLGLKFQPMKAVLQGIYR